MVITTDFNIFADKYHNRQHLPDDIINMIMNINTETIKNDIYKKRHNLFIKYLDYYFEEHGESVAINMYVGEDMRTDCEFLEYEDLWGTSFEKSINNKWGKDKIDYFLENDF